MYTDMINLIKASKTLHIVLYDYNNFPLYIITHTNRTLKAFNTRNSKTFNIDTYFIDDCILEGFTAITELR